MFTCLKRGEVADVEFESNGQLPVSVPVGVKLIPSIVVVVVEVELDVVEEVELDVVEEVELNEVEEIELKEI